MQSLLQKLQASSNGAVPQQHVACIAALLPGMPLHAPNAAPYLEACAEMSF